MTRKVPNAESVADHSWRVAILCLLLHTDGTPNDMTTTNNPNASDTDKNDTDSNDNATAKSSSSSSPLNVSKCMQMAVVHDLAEAIVGDIAPCDNISPAEKHALEQKAIHSIAQNLKSVGVSPSTTESSSSSSSSSSGQSSPSQLRLLDLYNEYEERTSNEAIVVKDLDLLEMILQAREYETMHPETIDLEEFWVGTPPSRFQNDWIRAIASELHLDRTRTTSTTRNNNKECHDDHVTRTIQRRMEDEEQQRKERNAPPQASDDSLPRRSDSDGRSATPSSPPSSPPSPPPPPPSPLSDLDHDFLKTYCQSRPDISEANVRHVLLALRDFNNNNERTRTSV